ncbi:M20 family metallopeptidase [Mesorhizobium sp. YC-39]|uniref:M20 aminoacylase family protein n=1 Tax=unclassified Mesorhizobium TaxID=325217 RepID=UPI0021E902FE|nr:MULTISPECIES: M20 aminoacylase family protein [unclassified Mesorhizobium]MCV3211493.1 M20 family metallopeptidase [Mesorhizobium sp. YC-2]MCV3233151.1 M20 family metallopeptidase [Mesorhizobium sp. YC-39]
MPVINRVADLHADIIAWRRDLHRHPELLYDVHRTSAFVAARLREFGCDEVVEGIGRTGVVGVIKGRLQTESSPYLSIGLRADMDALPILEATGLPYASQTPGRMHACGHDGHTAMLLGAASYLAETRNFRGNAVLIFQPAEEEEAGAAAMIRDGLMERFDVSEVFGMHNWPGLALGSFSIRPGAMMAAYNVVEINIEGRGGHASAPHDCIDPVLVGAQLVTAVQQIVSRNVDPLEAAGVTISEFHAGSTPGVIPQSAVLRGTIRSLSVAVHDLIKARLSEIVAGTAKMSGAHIELSFIGGAPLTFNHSDQTETALTVAKDLVGEANVHSNRPIMAAEDFGYMLEARPGAYILCGNGDSAGLHHPAYDFNDEAIPYGTSYWIKLVETKLAP